MSTINTIKALEMLRVQTVVEHAQRPEVMHTWLSQVHAVNCLLANHGQQMNIIINHAEEAF